MRLIFICTILMAFISASDSWSSSWPAHFTERWNLIRPTDAPQAGFRLSQLAQKQPQQLNQWLRKPPVHDFLVSLLQLEITRFAQENFGQGDEISNPENSWRSWESHLNDYEDLGLGFDLLAWDQSRPAAADQSLELFSPYGPDSLIRDLGTYTLLAHTPSHLGTNQTLSYFRLVLLKSQLSRKSIDLSQIEPNAQQLLNMRQAYLADAQTIGIDQVFHRLNIARHDPLQLTPQVAFIDLLKWMLARRSSEFSTQDRDNLRLALMNRFRMIKDSEAPPEQCSEHLFQEREGLPIASEHVRTVDPHSDLFRVLSPHRLQTYVERSKKSSELQPQMPALGALVDRAYTRTLRSLSLKLLQIEALFLNPQFSSTQLKSRFEKNWHRQVCQYRQWSLCNRELKEKIDEEAGAFLNALAKLDSKKNLSLSENHPHRRYAINPSDAKTFGLPDGSQTLRSLWGVSLEPQKLGYGGYGALIQHESLSPLGCQKPFLIQSVSWSRDQIIQQHPLGSLIQSSSFARKSLAKYLNLESLYQSKTCRFKAVPVNDFSGVDVQLALEQQKKLIREAVAQIAQVVMVDPLWDRIKLKTLLLLNPIALGPELVRYPKLNEVLQCDLFQAMQSQEFFKQLQSNQVLHASIHRTAIEVAQKATPPRLQLRLPIVLGALYRQRFFLLPSENWTAPANPNIAGAYGPSLLAKNYALKANDLHQLNKQNLLLRAQAMQGLQQTDQKVFKQMTALRWLDFESLFDLSEKTTWKALQSGFMAHQKLKAVSGPKRVTGLAAAVDSVHQLQNQLHQLLVQGLGNAQFAFAKVEDYFELLNEIGQNRRFRDDDQQMGLMTVFGSFADSKFPPKDIESILKQLAKNEPDKKGRKMEEVLAQVAGHFDRCSQLIVGQKVARALGETGGKKARLGPNTLGPVPSMIQNGIQASQSSPLRQGQDFEWSCAWLESSP